MQQTQVQISLSERLERLRRRWLYIGCGAATLWAVAASMACLMIGIWADLVFELSPELRVTVLWAASGSAVLLLVMMAAAAWRSGRVGALAQRLDRAGRTVGEIRTANDLMMDPSPRTLLAQGLKVMAVERAAMLAEKIAVREAVPVRPLMAAICGLLGMAGVALAIVLTAGSLAAAEYWRFRDPHGDHPPYSRVAFQVEPGNASVVYGAGQEIKVTTAGPTVERLDLVAIPTADAGNLRNLKRDIAKAEIVSMFGEPGGVWRATLAEVTVPTTYFVRCDAGRSKRFQLAVVTLPKLENVRFRIAPPAYTHAAAYEGVLPPQGLAGLRGTEVTVRARSNRPLSGGSLKIITVAQPAGGDTQETYVSHELLPNVSSGHEVVGSFKIQSTGRLEVRVRDVNDQESQDVLSTAIRILRDERPFVRIADPPALSLATPDVALPVSVLAEDDYGIAGVHLYRSLNDSRALPMAFEVPAPAPRRHNPATALAMPTYGLRPGDEIKLYARVEDNDPTHAKGAESEVALVRIISQEDFERLMLTRHAMEVLQARYERARQRMAEIADQIEALRKELDKLPPDAPLSQEMRDKLNELARKMKQHAEAIEASAESTLPFDIDKKMNAKLKDLAAKLGKSAAELEKFTQSDPIPSADEAKEGLDLLAKFCGGNQQQFEQETTRPLSELAKVYRLLQEQSRFVALYKRQKDLADRLESLKNKDDVDDPHVRSRMRDMEAEQYKLREELRNMLQDIEMRAANLPDEDRYTQLRETAEKFAAGLKASGAVDAMQEAESGLAAYSGTRGAQGSREAEQILASFLGKCNSMGQEGRACLTFAPQLSEDLGNTVDQLLASAGMQMGNEGTGAGVGYSAQSTNLDNVGLFGHLPTMGGDGRDGQNMNAAHLGQGGFAGNYENGEPGHVEPLGTLQAVGAGQGFVPPQYRQRVGEYFEQITDDVGEPARKK